MKKGFTLLEIIIVVVILSILSLISFYSFSSLSQNQALDKDTLLVLSVLEEARSLTLSAKDDSNYGIYFNDDKIILFKGEDFQEGNVENVIFNLNNSVEIKSVELLDSSNKVVFGRLRGNVLNYGKVILSLKNKDEVREIEILESGIIQLN